LLFLLSFAPFAPSRFKSPEPPKRAVHEAGANTRMHEYARPGGNRGWNRQDAKSAKVFLLFLPSFAAFAPLRFKSPEPPKGPSTKQTRIHECTNTPGPVAQVSNLQRKSQLEPPRREGREGFLLFLPSFALFAPSRFKSWNRQSGPSTKRTRIHECTNTPGPVAQVSNLQRKSQLEPPRREGREGFLLFLPSFAAFAPLRFKSWNRQDARSAKVFFLFLPLRPLRLRGSDFGTAKTRRTRRFFTFSSFPCALRLCG